MALRLPTLTRDEFEDLDEEAAAALITGRYRALSNGGCASEAAVLFAVYPQIAVDDALSLLSRGCPAETALRILL
jgi:hypothetical protein